MLVGLSNLSKFVHHGRNFRMNKLSRLSEIRKSLFVVKFLKSEFFSWILCFFVQFAKTYPIEIYIDSYLFVKLKSQICIKSNSNFALLQSSECHLCSSYLITAIFICVETITIQMADSWRACEVRWWKHTFNNNRLNHRQLMHMQSTLMETYL